MPFTLSEDELISIITKYVQGNEIDFNFKKNREFIRQFTGAILLLVPEAAAFLVENGLPDNDEAIKKAMIVISGSLKVLASQR